MDSPILKRGNLSCDLKRAISVPLCAQLITCVHAPPLVITSNQLLLTSAGITAPLLVTGPSFPPVTQGPISMLPGTPIAFSGAPGAPVGLPAPYNAAGCRQHHTTPCRALDSAALKRMTGMPWSNQPMPYASTFMAPPAWQMYMPRPFTQPPFMQAQFEELARQHQD